MEKYNQRDFLAGLINNAIKTEEISISFYSELARKFSRYTNIKEFLERSSKDKILIKNLLSGVELSLDKVNFYFSSIDNFYLAQTDISSYNNKIDVIDPKLDPIASLDLAYQFEKQSMLLYIGMRDVCGDMTHLSDLIATKKELIALLLGHMDKLIKKAGSGKLSW